MGTVAARRWSALLPPQACSLRPRHLPQMVFFGLALLLAASGTHAERGAGGESLTALSRERLVFQVRVLWLGAVDTRSGGPVSWYVRSNRVKFALAAGGADGRCARR